MKNYLQQLADDLVSLHNRLDDFDIESLVDNDTFVTTVMELTQIAVRTSQQEKIASLRNAALNSALPSTPDDTRIKIFCRWVDQFTPTHIKILKVFMSPEIPSIDLQDNSWKENINLSILGQLIETTYPELVGNYELHIQIIKELYDEGLISNTFPSLMMMNRIEHSPKITPLGDEFLRFLESPLVSRKQ